MLTCQDVTELATDSLEGRLPLRRRLALRLHLALCPHCRTYTRQLGLTVRVLRRLATGRRNE